MTLAKRPAMWLFAASLTSIYSVIYFISRTPQAISHAGMFSAAALFDLTVTASAAFYFLLVRSGYFSRLTLLAISLSGLRAAAFLLPNVDQQYLPDLKWVGAPLELVLIAAIVRRLRRVPSGSDTLAQIRHATAAIIPYKGLAHIVAAEVAVFYYALFSWRAKPETSRDSQTFSCAEASGYSFLGTMLILLILCEGAPLHFLLLHYSAAAAWIVTGLDAYGILWAVATIRAVRLRAILVDEHWVRLRIGVVWEADIPRQDIVSCRRAIYTTAPSKKPGYLKAVVLNDPQYIIELSRPTLVVGFYGQRRTVTQIGVAVDQAEAFAAALNCR